MLAMCDSKLVSNLADETSLTAGWPVLPLPGLAPDSVGNYLVSLGLLALAGRKWAGVRGCWRSDQFLLVNGPAEFTPLVTFLLNVAQSKGWSAYGRNWSAKQKEDTKRQNSAATSRWRSRQAAEGELALFHSHLAVGERLSFNPLFGSGGNAGRRDFSTGWKKAITMLAGAKGKTKKILENDLASFLAGGSCNHLDDYSAGSWFSSANKTYNSGIEKPFRKGQVTPWAMALACESFPLLKGSASRQLGAHRTATGAFPFILNPAAPESAGEAGKSVGEAWFPIWSRPMSFAEASALFSRGRAEVRGQGAVTPATFSAAIVQRGVDAGIAEFRRFILFHTTSENTFESRLADIVPVNEIGDSDLTTAVNIALGLRESLPRDRKKGQRWIYAGVRGPLDHALIELAARRDPDAKRSLVDAMVGALRAVDRNRGYREQNVEFRTFPAAWAESLIGEHEEITAEIRLAYAMASLYPTSTNSADEIKQITAPFLAYWLGAENQRAFWTIQKRVPLRRVWGGGEFASNAAAVLRRRLFEASPDAEPPFEGFSNAGLADIEAFLLRKLDETELRRWLFRFSLFSGKDGNRWASSRRFRCASRLEAISPSIALFALFKPIFDARLIRHNSIGASRSVRVGTLSRIAALLLRGDTNSAVQAARNAYHAVGVELAEFECPFDAQNSRHLLASLMAPVRSDEIMQAFVRWRLPKKANSNP